jgi:nitric oxide reductase subunit B
MSTNKLWIGLFTIMTLSFSVLGYFGSEIYNEKPPIPEKVISPSGEVLFTRQDIQEGQNVWQSIGGQELGSIWGHGAYLAPDWSADWLHKEAIFILNQWSMKEFRQPFDQLHEEQKAGLKIRLQKELRTNTYNEKTKNLLISTVRLEAIQSNSDFYRRLFTNDPSLTKLRSDYAISVDALKDDNLVRKMNAFFFWTSWSCVTQRPDQLISYTHNWPHDELVGNVATSALILWTGFSIMMLLIGIGLLAFFHAKNREPHIDKTKLPKKDPLLGLNPTPSMQATLKYVWVVMALILVQILLGIILGHYGVEGDGFYGFPLSKYLPYSVARTWHLQLSIFWIATSWLATGLFMAPAISNHEPRFQKFGVNFLFICLLIIVVGSLAGEWLGVMQKLDLVQNFWFGHQGLEYVDLGKFWQFFLSIGLFLWLALMTRALWPALKTKNENRDLLILFFISCVAIAVFYTAGLMWGIDSHLSLIEYWRWWVVHLWVEGFFEVFATVVIAFLFVRMKLLDIKYATSATLTSTMIFLSGGIIGTFHHLYFAGTPTSVIALGATFSALEVVPLVFLGFEAFHNYRLSLSTKWVRTYKWPLYFFISVSFWNLLGAGVFGFMINPPIALYYMQGLNTTPVHSHAALFGVYGMLGIGLMLFMLKGLSARKLWKDKVISFSFWSLNIGLLLMIFLSILPIGLLQTVASVEHGTWFARSAEFLQQPNLQILRWLRVLGDTIFALGTVGLIYFVIGLKTGWSLHDEIDLSDEDFPDAGN